MSPRRNRVTPSGDIVADPARGTFMGNRGILHDENGNIVRPWRSKAWLICRLEFKGRRRRIMEPGRYTELFFLDEATALAAGHRPCFECRRNDYRAFAALLQNVAGQALSAAQMDALLHADRIGQFGTKRTFNAVLNGLPDGSFFRDGEGEWLVWGASVYLWTPGGYARRRPRSATDWVTVLTPRATVAVLRAGWSPAVHSSLGAC